MPALAFLGLGHMGTPMAHRLVAAGQDVLVWNRTRSRTAPLAAAGARVAESPADAASGAEVVLTMLSDPAAVESVLFGQSGAVPAMRPGACLVEMSTIGPDAVRTIAARLPAGVVLVDAPVGGGVGQAEAGQLRMFAGGAPEDVARVEPVLSCLGTVVRCGAVGSGAAIKLVNNTALIAGMALLGEIVGLADSLGLPRDLVLDVLGAGPLGGALQRALAGGGRFTVDLAAKDLDLAMAVAAPPMSAAARATLRDAATGNGKADLRSIAHLSDH
jgi:3-hydroxyisobutyrate dehydrogenase-like beta-hydroxyacid dehydrogenase